MRTDQAGGNDGWSAENDFSRFKLDHLPPEERDMQMAERQKKVAAQEKMRREWQEQAEMKKNHVPDKKRNW
jgi:hypothetical protein